MKKNVAGSIYLIGIGLLLAAVGGVFTWLLGTSFARAKEMDRWQETPCFILEAELGERKIGQEVPREYRLRILYGYDFGDEPLSCEDYDLRGNAWVKDPSRVRALLQSFPAGTQQLCWVNPDNPEQAVLKKETKAPGYSIWFPILFVVGGLGIVAKVVLQLFQKGK